MGQEAAALEKTGHPGLFWRQLLHDRRLDRFERKQGPSDVAALLAQFLGGRMRFGKAVPDEGGLVRAAVGGRDGGNPQHLVLGRVQQAPVHFWLIELRFPFRLNSLHVGRRDE